jgi:glutamate-1-semialdehyde 2,1-aminomutase
MPFMTFDGDHDFRLASYWTDIAARHGAYFHPMHNWFLCAAHTDADIDRALQATDVAFAATATIV